MDRVEARRRRCPHLEGECAHTARDDGGLGLRGDAVRRHPVDPEGRPLRVVLVHGKTGFLTERSADPRLAPGIAERDRERTAELSDAQRRERGLRNPAAVIVDHRHDRHEHTLILEPCDAVDDRSQRNADGPGAERRFHREGERGDGTRPDRHFVLDRNAVRGWPPDVHTKRAECAAVAVDAERDLAAGEPPRPGLGAGVAEQQRHLRRRRGLHRGHLRLRRPS